MATPRFGLNTCFEFTMFRLMVIESVGGGAHCFSCFLLRAERCLPAIDHGHQVYPDSQTNQAKETLRVSVSFSASITGFLCAALPQKRIHFYPLHVLTTKSTDSSNPQAIPIQRESPNSTENQTSFESPKSSI